MAQEGKVDFLSCPLHTEEEAVFELMHREENDKVVLDCYACGYKKIVGQELYDNIRRVVENDSRSSK
jgi:uncharacterized Zn finger protein